jgi:CrcB protein
MTNVLLAIGIAALGGLGAVVRFAIHSAVIKVNPADFPLGTFIVNISGSFLLGTLAGAAEGHHARLLIGTALLGAFTTFSTWMFESERLASDGYVTTAVVNIAISVVLGLGAVALGVVVGAAI